MSKNTIFDFLKSKKIYLLVALLIIGIVIIFIGKSGEKKTENVQNGIEELDPSQYSEMLEERI